MDMLVKSDFLTHLSGQVYLSQFDAFNDVKAKLGLA